MAVVCDLSEPEKKKQNTDHPHLDAQIAKSQSQRFEIAINSRDLKSQGTSDIAARIASKSVESQVRNRN